MSLALLPCEVFHREFDAKLILASKLAVEKKMVVLIGYDKYFNILIPYLPKSILLDKSCSSVIFNGRIKPVKKNNGFVLVSDEEGFNNLTDNFKYSWLNRVDREAANLIDSYLAWGSIDKQFFSQINELNSKIEIAGNCRSDLLNDIGKTYFKDCISSYSSIFNDFVLISDNFCVERWNQNYALPAFNVDPKKANAAQKEFEESQRDFSGRRDFMCGVLEPIIAERQDINFVIRPHPVANPLWWQKRFNKYRNVFIIYQNPIEPWLHSCKLLISMGCTTAMQALIAKKLVIEITRPTNANLAKSTSFASKLVSNKATSSDELGQILSQSLKIHPLPSLLSEAWANLDVSASSVFADIISRYNYQLQSSEITQLYNILSKVTTANMPSLDKEKWHYPSFDKIKQRLKRLHSTILKSAPLNIKQLIPGLYLLSSR